MSDTIYRQQAIDALDGFRCGTKAAWKVIEDLPSAQTEGKWINVDTIFHIQIYDDEHEEFTTKEMSLADILDAYTDEGCPEPSADMRGEIDV